MFERFKWLRVKAFAVIQRLWPAVTGVSWLFRLAALAMLAFGAALFAPAVAGHANASAGVAQSASDPQSLTNALATTPFAAGELPSGFSETDSPQMLPTDLLSLTNAAGAVYVPVDNGSGAISAIAYAIFNSDADAAAALSQAPALIPGLQIVSSSTPSGFDYPATLYSGSIGLGFFGAAGGSACVVVVNNVVVAGVSIQAGTSQGGNGNDACALAASGVAHLQELS